jgi:hypothetical protein
MARPKISKKQASSKKLRRSAEKKKAAPHRSESESSVESAPQERLPIADLASQGPDSDGVYHSDNDGHQSQPSPQLSQDFDRSPERNSPDGSPERSHRSLERTSPHRSLERTSPHRSSERTSRQTSRSSVRSAQEAAEQSDEDLFITGHFPANPAGDAGPNNGASAAVPAGQWEKFTDSPPASPSRPRSTEAPPVPPREQVNSALLVDAAQSPQALQQQRQATDKNPAHKRAHAPGAQTPVLPGSNPHRPATVQSRLPPANESMRRINALVDDDKSASTTGTRDGSNAVAAQANPPRANRNTQELSPTKPGKESEAVKQRPNNKDPPTTAHKQSRVLDSAALDSATPTMMAMLAALTAQIQQQDQRLAARERADEQAAKRQHASEVELFREEQLLEQIRSLQESMREKEEAEAQREQERRGETPSKPFAALEDPEYLCRFESLMKAGQRSMAEVAEALQATKEHGTYSSGRADHYLKAKAMSRVQHALQTANRNLTDDQVPIAEHSKLGTLLQAPGNEDAVDIVTRLRDVHARARTKTAHSPTPAIAAGNLVGTAVIKNDASMGKKGLAFLSSVAYAVCEDCPQCTELRHQAEKEREWKAKQSAEAEAIKKAKSKVIAKKRLVLPFKPIDSVLDKTLPKGFCAICTHGYHKGRYLYRCDECNRGIHLLCTDWHHLRLAGGGSTWFACDPCLDTRDRAIEEGNASMEYVVVEEDFIDHELAPHSTEAAGGPADTPPASALADRGVREDEGVDLEKRGAAAGGGGAPPPDESFCS